MVAALRIATFAGNIPSRWPLYWGTMMASWAVASDSVRSGTDGTRSAMGAGRSMSSGGVVRRQVLAAALVLGALPTAVAVGVMPDEGTGTWLQAAVSGGSRSRVPRGAAIWRDMRRV